jgi:tetratricopeptide (TPR) repeat protein
MTFNVINTSLGRRHPLLCFQVFHCLAHSQNLQGHVNLSVKHLLKADSYLQTLSNISECALSNPQTFRPPIIEIYLNLGYAYFFQEKQNLALKYTKKAIDLAHSILALIESGVNFAQDAEFIAQSKFHFNQILI